MNLHETKIAREYLDKAVAGLKARVQEIAGDPGVDHQPPVTAVRWEKLSGPEMNAITQLLNGARFIINNPPKEQTPEEKVAELEERLEKLQNDYDYEHNTGPYAGNGSC